MTRNLLIAASLAVLALGGCKKTGDASAAMDQSTKPSAPVPPPTNGDWTSVVSATPAGGFKMGNPAARVQLTEYGSLTCPHCAEFDEKGVPTLLASYVKTGKVAWEFRNYLRDSADVTAALIARCGGPASFFGMARGFYADQKNWFGKIVTADPKQTQAIQDMAPVDQYKALATLAGLYDFAAQRGLDKGKVDRCFANQAEATKLVQMNSDVVAQYPDFPGTPTFLINGKMLSDTATWDKLAPQLKAAVGS